jgi:hypothetical protein
VTATFRKSEGVAWWHSVENVGMARLADIVFDCARPAALARFWAAALDDYDVAPYDAEELERLRSIFIDDVEDDPSVLVQATPDRPRLWFQRVPEPKRVKNRVHLDLRADNLETELSRLTSLGATVSDDQPVADLVVMRDPEGNEFCLLRP